MNPISKQKSHERHDDRPDIPSEIQNSSCETPPLVNTDFRGHHEEGGPDRMNRAADEEVHEDEEAVVGEGGDRGQERARDVDEGEDEHDGATPEAIREKPADQYENHNLKSTISANVSK